MPAARRARLGRARLGQLADQAKQSGRRPAGDRLPIRRTGGMPRGAIRPRCSTGETPRRIRALAGPAVLIGSVSSMLSRNLEQTLHRALGLANERRHEYATLEHLLLALTDDTDASTVLRACGVDTAKLKRALTEFLDKDLAGLVTERAGDPKPTAGFQRVVQRAAIHVQSSGRDEVTGANVLVALFSERESHAVYFLQLQDMTRLDAVNFISHGIAKAPGRTAQRPVQGAKEEGAAENEREEKPSRRAQDALSNY